MSRHRIGILVRRGVLCFRRGEGVLPQECSLVAQGGGGSCRRKGMYQETRSNFAGGDLVAGLEFRFAGVFSRFAGGEKGGGGELRRR
jgi:hypothetical protein